jgi:hypothetical protein
MTPRHLILVGAVGLVVGSLMPWATLSVAFASLTVNGTEGDGQITVIVGVLVAILALTRSGTAGTIIIGIAGFVGAGTAIHDMVNLTSSFAAATRESSFIHGSIGPGLWITLLGAVVVLAGVGWTIQQMSQRPQAAPFTG